ncbi:MAG: sigma-54-dependent Fis family transcriptional regulator [Deltaproteobacteria bacterium]|nr:sigma-54-dependent Fis family transcriptional regulator [Deltaproteobacteria bacterium]
MADLDLGRAALALLDVDRLPDLLEQAVSLISRATEAREIYVELTPDDAATASLHFAAGCSDDRVHELQGIVSRGIIGEAMATGRTVETANAKVDPRFFELESVQQRELEAVICVPVGRDQPIGVAYIQGHASGGSLPFTATARQDVELIAQVLALAVERAGVAPRARAIRGEGPASDPFSGILGSSVALKEVVEKLRFAAPLDVPILFTGPSGAGKTQLAQVTHVASRRRTAPFVEINCAALPEPLFENELFGADPGAHSSVPKQGVRGKVEMADGGTLFLDEIADLPLMAQGKILQLLQSRQYYRLGSSTPRSADIRVMAATNVDLSRAIQEKRFREDLYYRLKVLEVRVPSLDERREDVVPLARHFLRAALERHGLAFKVLAPSAIRALGATSWAGNVRELAHRIEAAALAAEQRSSDRVELRDVFPGQASPATGGAAHLTLQDATRAFQRKHVAAVLEATGWNMTETARILDVSRAHLYTIVRGLELTRAK